MPAGTIVDGLKDAIAEIIAIFASAQHEIDFVVPPSMLSVAGAYDTVEYAKRFMQHGGVMRGVTTVSHANIEEIRTRLETGEDLRHSDLHYEIFMFMADRQQSVSAINTGIEEYTRDTPLIAFRSEDPTYAEYLLASFENVWSQAVPAAQRIQELEQEPKS